MTTTALDYCAGLCKSADHYIIYPYSYSNNDPYTDIYYIKCDYDNKDSIYYRVSRTQGQNRYYMQEITANQFISPGSDSYFYSDAGSDLVGAPVSRYVHTFGVDLFGCFLIGAVLTAIIGGVCKKCLS